jgi:hypothetical protein
MKDDAASPGGLAGGISAVVPEAAGRAHSCEGGAIAAARRRLRMIDRDSRIPPAGPAALPDAPAGSRQRIVCYLTWQPGRPTAGQGEARTFRTSQVSGPCRLHFRNITYAISCRERNAARYRPPAFPCRESVRYRDFRSCNVPWCSGHASVDAILTGRTRMLRLAHYLSNQDDVFGTYWTTLRGVEASNTATGSWASPCTGGRCRGRTRPSGWPQQSTSTRTEGGPRGWPPAPRMAGGTPQRPVATTCGRPLRRRRHR